MADEGKGVIQVLKHTLGLEKGQDLDVVKLARWVGLFILVSSLILAIWMLFSPLFAPGVSFTTRIRLFWGALITPTWTALAILLLAEMVDRVRKPT